MRRRTTAVGGLLFAAALSIGFSGTASAEDLDCSDFATQAEAQASFNSTPGDPNDLDRDDDGIACEALPGSSGAEAVSEDDTVLGDDTDTEDDQVSTQPEGAVEAGDGSTTADGSALPYVLGGLAFAGAGGAAVAARRSSRSAA
jgi:Excalibur calcium-binding domain